MDIILVVFLAAIVVVGGMVLGIISVTKKSSKQLNKERYQSRWLVIDNGLKRDESHSFQLSVLAADKLLDAALKERGFAGQTMGERLKSANNEFSNVNAVWTAHKVRNKIAHEPDVVVSYELAKQSLDAFRQGLKDVGAI